MYIYAYLGKPEGSVDDGGGTGGSRDTLEGALERRDGRQVEQR